MKRITNRLAVSLALCAGLLVAGAARGQRPSPVEVKKPARDSYRIDLRLNFDERSYSGIERVRFVNRDDRPASALYFHLYPNLRAEAATTRGETADELYADEPRLDVTKATAGGQPLALSYEDGGATLRVQLRDAVAAGAVGEVELSFRGTVPEIDPDETSLTAHVIQQVGAAMRETREVRRARDTNFSSRGVMLLASFHPVLAAREGGDWLREVEPTVGEAVFADVADYDVRVVAPAGVNVFSPAEGARERGADAAHVFSGENLRGFALVAGRALRSEEREAAPGLRVRVVYRAEHERVARRVLSVGTDAARTYSSRFGPLPLRTVTVAEAPLVAGLGSADFAGLSVIASAFFVDF
ncbi:MAG TPA: hypothetical protein VK422_00740, partial [Pyrinomonadaceae bacterium]|nr:hypothetical protein [Pyrinomonadaceae bacterium]